MKSHLAVILNLVFGLAAQGRYTYRVAASFLPLFEVFFALTAGEMTWSPFTFTQSTGKGMLGS